MTPEGKREENGRGFGSRPFFVGGAPIRRRDDRLRLEEGARKRVTFGVPGRFAVRLPILIRKRYSVAADSAAPDRRATTPHIRLGIRTFPIRTDANARRTKVPEPFIDDLTFREIENDRKGKGSFSRLSDRLDVFRSLLLVLWKRLRRARVHAFAPLSSASRCDRRHFDRSSMECSVPPVAADAPDRFGSRLHALRFFYLTLANMAAFSHGTPPEWIMLPVGLALSLAGLLLGRILRRFVSGKD